jgi:hypothetical protein
MEIEEVAKKDPKSIIVEPIDIDKVATYLNFYFFRDSLMRLLIE